MRGAREISTQDLQVVKGMIQLENHPVASSAGFRPRSSLGMEASEERSGDRTHSLGVSMRFEEETELNALSYEGGNGPLP